MSGNTGNVYLELRFSSSISAEMHIPVKMFPKKILMKIFPRLLSWRKRFCKNKKNFDQKLSVKFMENSALYYEFGSLFLKRNTFQ